MNQLSQRNAIAALINYQAELHGVSPYRVEIALDRFFGLDEWQQIKAWAHDAAVRFLLGKIPEARVSTSLGGQTHRSRVDNGEWNVVTHDLAPFDSMMTHVADPRNTPEMLALRESIRAWDRHPLRSRSCRSN